MTVRSVLRYPDPRLREKAAPVIDFDGSVRSLVDDLFDTLYSTESAIGLCAPQVNDPRQILVMDLSKTRDEPQVFINPKVTARALWGFVEESCLSVPDTKVNVLRATAIRVQAQDPDGQPFETELERLYAVVLQHEMDHFAGKLLVDKMSFFRRFRFKRQHRAIA